MPSPTEKLAYAIVVGPAKKINAVCEFEETAERIIESELQLETYVKIRPVTLKLIGGLWYGPTNVKKGSPEDVARTAEKDRYAEIEEIVAAAGLSERDLETLVRHRKAKGPKRNLREGDAV